MVKTGGKNILFDPFITPNPLASHVDIRTVIPHVILVSHAHNDHVADLVEIAKYSKALVVCSFEIHEWLHNKGVENTIPMNIGGTVDVGFAKIKMVNAIHSSTFADGSPGGNPAGFVVFNQEECFYYAGDTGLTYDMKLIAEEFELDFAFLPIGDHFTMGVTDALKAAKFVNTKKVIGMHYNTFPPIEINTEHAVETFKREDIMLHLLNIEDTIEL